MVEGKDNIKDLFSEKLNGFEANVRPELWANISSQIGVTSGAVATGGLSVLTKAIIGITAAASIVGLSVVILNSSEKEEKQIENKSITEQKVIIPNDSEQKVIDAHQIDKIKETNKIVEEPISLEVESINELYVGGSNDKTETSTPELNKKRIIEDKKVEPLPVKIVKPEVVSPIVPEIVEHKEIKENTIITEKESKIVLDLPNVFTPNGDRVNDFLSIESHGLIDFSVVVLDNKNNIVYKSSEPNFSWDGVGMNGDLVPAGNYVYYVTARDTEGKLVTRHSALHIQR